MADKPAVRKTLCDNCENLYRTYRKTNNNKDVLHLNQCKVSWEDLSPTESITRCSQHSILAKYESSMICLYQDTKNGLFELWRHGSPKIEGDIQQIKDDPIGILYQVIRATGQNVHLHEDQDLTEDIHE